MINGLNHITLSCSQLNRSVYFYQHLLGLTLEYQWDKGAYFSAGELWFCLIEDKNYRANSQGYNHIAFNVAKDDFLKWEEKLRDRGIKEWQSNHSEGDSIYFLDPDGHQLELHVGNLQSRLASKPPNNTSR